MKNNFIVEVCVDHLESALIAHDAGADRLELCQALQLGGLTPDRDTFRLLKSSMSIPIFILIRPRAGDFNYSDNEKDLIKNQIKTFEDLGADGFVVGALDQKRKLDFTFVEQVKNQASVPVTFHRAFDFIEDQIIALDRLISIGIDRILTSGGKSNCIKGMDQLKALRNHANGRINILPGSGINLKTVDTIVENLSPSEIHLSAKELVQQTTYDDPFDIDYWRCNSQIIKTIKTKYS